MNAAGGLDALFEPRSIAVVGASAAPGKAGYAILEALDGFGGDVFPVNPRGGQIRGRTAYPRLTDISRPIDLAVLAIPAEAVPGALREGAAAGVRAAVSYAGGFGEAGAAGVRLQHEVAEIVRTAGIRLLGPNTSGFVNPIAGVCTSFVPGMSAIGSGTVAVVAQSGGVNHALAFLAQEHGIGLRLSVGLGNAVDVGFADVLTYLADDRHTRAIALHLEGVVDGRALVDAVAAIAPRIPIVVLKVGRADVGDFARSHTGNLTGSWQLARSALAQAGAVVVDDTTELLDAACALAAQRIAPSREPGVAVVTGQAGPGLLIADTLRSMGVAVPPLEAPTVAALGQLLPPLTYQQNPVDTGRPAESFGDVLRTVAGDAGVDAMLVYAVHEPGALDPAVTLAEARTSGVPLVFGTGGPWPAIRAAVADVRDRGIPAYLTPERAARALRALVADARAAHRVLSGGAPRSAGAPTGRVPLPGAPDEVQAKAVLASIGIAIPRGRACASHAEAHAAFAELGMPVAVKVLDPAIAHKSDVGGVTLNVSSASALDAALETIDRLSARDGPRYLVEEMLEPTLELIVGGTRDPAFGPSVLVGLGGIVAEAQRDIALRLAPLTLLDAEEMLDELRGRVLLDGFRGRPAVDRAALAQILVAIGDLLVAEPSIAEVDINPLAATSRGLVALDALLLRS